MRHLKPSLWQKCAIHIQPYTQEFLLLGDASIPFRPWSSEDIIGIERRITLGTSEQINYPEMTGGWGYQRNVFNVCLPAIDARLFVVEAGSIQQVQAGQQIFFCAPAIICWAS